MNAKNFFLFIVIVIGLIFGVQIFWHLLGLVTVAAYAIAGLVFFGGLMYCAYLMAKGSLFGSGANISKGKPTYKVWNTRASNVYIFREEPSLKDIAMLSDELHLTQLELAGDVFAVQNDSHVIVLEDGGKEAVKVKFKQAKKKDRDAIGWVPRSSLIREEKLIG